MTLFYILCTLQTHFTILKT